MFGALGFFLGCLLGLMLAPPLWNRAVKLTTRRLEATMPMTLAEIQADKDQIRADFAIQLRKVEVALEKSKEKAARELIEANKRRVEIQKLNGNLESSKGELHEAENANRVLQQTIKRRLPDLDARLKAAKKALTDLETVNAELRTTVASQSDALKVARATVHNQRADIDQLRLSLESGSGSGRGSAKNDSRAIAENQRLTAELSRAQEELERVRTSSEEIAFLRRELGHLASQILEAARKQAPAWQSTAAASALTHHEAEARAEADQDLASAHESADMQEAVAYAGNGSAEQAPEFAETPYAESPHAQRHEEESAAEPYAAEEAYAAEPSQYAEADQYEVETGDAAPGYHTEEAHPEEPGQDEQTYAAAHQAYDVESFNGEDEYEVEENYETYEIQGHYAAQSDEEQEDAAGTEDDGGEAEYGEAHEAEDEVEEQPQSLSKRFAARRAKRQAQKSGGGSLTSRLRGLVADSPEKRG